MVILCSSEVRSKNIYNTFIHSFIHLVTVRVPVEPRDNPSNTGCWIVFPSITKLRAIYFSQSIFWQVFGKCGEKQNRKTQNKVHVKLHRSDDTGFVLLQMKDIKVKVIIISCHSFLFHINAFQLLLFNPLENCTTPTSPTDGDRVIFSI